jgi:hypothetical protein
MMQTHISVFQVQHASERIAGMTAALQVITEKNISENIFTFLLTAGEGGLILKTV